MLRLAVGLAEGEQPAPGGGATLTFGTTDIHAVKTALAAARVRQDDNVQEIPDMVRLLTFYDSDGNALMSMRTFNPQLRVRQWRPALLWLCHMQFVFIAPANDLQI